MSGSMLNNIISTFQGFFSRAFWFGSFLPVALVAAVHGLFAWLRYPEWFPLKQWLTASFDSLTLFPAVFAALVVLAYALTPLIPLFRGVLDGSLLPEWIYDWLRRERVVFVRAVRANVRAALETSAAYDRLLKRTVEELRAARAAGLHAGGPPQRNLVEAAESSIKPLRKQIEAGATPPIEDARRVVDTLAAALRDRPLPAPPPPPDPALARRLDACHDLLIRLLNYARAEANHRFKALTVRHSTVLAIETPQATGMADARWLTERYSFNAYKVDFDYLWPRLQLVLPPSSGEAASKPEGAFIDRMGWTRSQVDFAVLSLALVLTVPAVWLSLLYVTASSPWPFVALGIASPFVAFFFYRLAVESEMAFGEVVKAAIDRYRLELLKTLHQPPPATLLDERQIWQTLRRAEESRDVHDLIYRYPSDQARPAQ
jgi:hypothetical protein